MKKNWHTLLDYLSSLLDFIYVWTEQQENQVIKINFMKKKMGTIINANIQIVQIQWVNFFNRTHTFDWEDLFDYCLKKNSCLVLNNQLFLASKFILCYYSLILKSSIIRQMNINWKGVIIVIDEAHYIKNFVVIQMDEQLIQKMFLKSLLNLICWLHLNHI
jgi:hypothetical protein